jgi:very-short-patch-repair endonuclease
VRTAYRVAGGSTGAAAGTTTSDYAEFGVSVELDGRAAHPAELAFRDHRRDNAAVLIGSRVLRYGYADVAHRACAVAAEVAAVLCAQWVGS